MKKKLLAGFVCVSLFGQILVPVFASDDVSPSLESSIDEGIIEENTWQSLTSERFSESVQEKDGTVTLLEGTKDFEIVLLGNYLNTIEHTYEMNKEELQNLAS